MANLYKKSPKQWDTYSGHHNVASKLWRGLITTSRVLSGNLWELEIPTNPLMRYPSDKKLPNGSEGYVKGVSEEGVEAYKKTRGRRFMQDPRRPGNKIDPLDLGGGKAISLPNLSDKNPMGTFFIGGMKWEPYRSKLSKDIMDAGLSSSISPSTYTDFSYGITQRDNKIILEVSDPNDYDDRPTHIALPFIPKEVEVTPGIKVVPILTPGRNTGFYHYTGAEDTIEFNIDWFFIGDETKRNVIRACRLIESWAKNDGYKKKPYTIRVIWGNEDVLFDGMKWVIASAPYSLTNFERGHNSRPNGNYSGRHINTGLLPSQARQIITLKRVSEDNLTREDITHLKDFDEYQDMGSTMAGSTSLIHNLS